MQKLKKLFRVSRPISWLNTAYPFAAGYYLITGVVDWRLIVGTLFFLIPYNLLMYGVNDVFDYESDIKNPRKGSLEGAIESRVFHPTILRWSVFATLPFTLLFIATQSLLSTVTLILVLFFVIAYSAPKLRFKERPFIDSITSSLHFVGPLLFALSFAQFPVNAWPFVIGFFLWGMASHAFGAVQDILPDRTAGIASIATVIGARWTVRLSLLLYLVSCFIVALAGGLAIVVAQSGLVYALNVAPYLNISDRDSEQSNRGWKRFIWLNYFVGMIVTFTLIAQVLAQA